MRLVLFSIVLFVCQHLNASHIVGGTIYYDYLGNFNYKFYVSVYRDESSTGAAYDDPLMLTIYNSSNVLIQNLALPATQSTPVPNNMNNPCLVSVPNVATSNMIYTVVVNLPPTPGGYNVSYQRCCRGPNITNLVQPDNTGFTLTCHVPGTTNNNYINSAARFDNYPPLTLCNNDQLVFDHSAIDPDGDQLVYSLTTPYAGASSANPAPNQAPPPSYPLVQWLGGFSAANPLGPGASISIDANTGLLTADPNFTGLFVVGIKVDEIRNGVVINSTIRDFIFKVFACQFSAQAVVPDQDQMAGFNGYCDGLTINFENNSYGGTEYAWDFGVPGTNTDVSNVFEPTFTYPSPGQYQATLVVNPGLPCTDTVVIDIMVYNEMAVDFTFIDSQCVVNNSYDFTANIVGDPGTTIIWDFGSNANPSTANTTNVSNVQFSQAGTYSVTASVNYAVCEAEFTDEVHVLPEPVSEIIIPNNVECGGLTVDFTNNTQNATNYEWNFGDGTGTSSANNPSHTFPAAGTYTVTLSSWATLDCVNTDEVEITVNEPLVVEFTSEDSLCFTNNSFNFDGSVSGPPNSVFTWNFGPFASIPFSNDIDVLNVNFNTTGTVPITLTGTFENCIESVTHNIYIFQEPSIDFAIQPGLQCVPFNAQFIDQSFSETPLTYLWEFGDGGTSNEQNPSHLYTQTGPYPVTLTINSSTGCVVQLTLTNDTLVHVRPKPTAGFSVTPEYTDICHSLITFIDESQGAVEHYYWFDDTSGYANVANIEYTYLTDGWHRPMQIVTNEWGCTDTAYNELFIEPYVVYAPNSFTPDADEFNNTFKPIVYLEPIDWRLRIYNRWGEVVFESLDYKYGWDGTGPTGKLASSGAYVWEITYKSCEPINPTRTIQGHVNLLR